MIVGVGDTEPAGDAIALAEDLAAGEPELTLAHVVVEDRRPTRGSGGPGHAAARQRTLELLAAARAKSQVAARLSSTRATSVAGGLHQLAASRRADLLVIGSCRRGLIGRVVCGDDTRAALNDAPCAVAVAPPGYSAHAGVPRKIGVAYDGSPESEHALAMARQLAAARGANLSVFQAVPPPVYVHDPWNVAGEADRAVANVRKQLGELGDVEVHAASGPAVEELALYSASVDLLVIGSHGDRAIGRLLHQSTPEHLARAARCPLLVVATARPGEATSAGNENAGRAA